MNILILTGKFGMGHYSVAATLSRQLTNRIENVNVIVEDILSNVLKRNSDFLYKSYSQLIKHGKPIYNAAYRRRDNKAIRFHIPKHYLKALDYLVENMKIDVIISTLPICSLCVSDYKRITGKQILLITYITDFFCHNDWLHPYTDMYMTASEFSKKCLIEKGITEPNIYVSGIPVGEQFRPINRNNQTSGKQRLLVMGGGLGLLPNSLSFYRDLNELETIETTIVTGINKPLFDRLNNKYPNIKVYGYVDNIYEQMQKADLVLTKPGCATLFEAIYAELPIVMFPPSLEQEIQNAEFITKNRLGIMLSNNNRSSVTEINSIAHNNQSINEIQENMRSFKTTINDHVLMDVLGKYRMNIK